MRVGYRRRDVTALYRKYRSAVLADLIGQDHIVRTLSNELRAGHVAHAYLFAGIRGTGKTSTARILARAVNCLEPVDGEPCNHCSACSEILDGSAVDVLEIDAASNRGIDEMRELRERVRYLPARLRSKVYIIDEAHMLTSEAWNAFLKTLEEPPAHVLFILCTTEPHKVPDTVRSRVQRFDFGRVSSARIDEHLQVIAGAEAVELEPAAARLIARAAQGSVRDGLSLLDQCFATGDRPVTTDTCRRALGLAHPEVIRQLLDGLAGRDAAASLRAAAAAFDAGADPRQLLRECSRLARAAELVAVGFAEGARLDADEDDLCRQLAAREQELAELRARAAAFATELKATADQAAADATERLRQQHQSEHACDAHERDEHPIPGFTCLLIAFRLGRFRLCFDPDGLLGGLQTDRDGGGYGAIIPILRFDCRARRSHCAPLFIRFDRHGRLSGFDLQRGSGLLHDRRGL